MLGKFLAVIGKQSVVARFEAYCKRFKKNITKVSTINTFTKPISFLYGPSLALNIRLQETFERLFIG